MSNLLKTISIPSSLSAGPATPKSIELYDDHVSIIYSGRKDFVYYSDISSVDYELISGKNLMAGVIIETRFGKEKVIPLSGGLILCLKKDEANNMAKKLCREITNAIG